MILKPFLRKQKEMLSFLNLSVELDFDIYIGA